jgi:hypothetical protein
MPAAIDELDLITPAALVGVHDRSDISAVEPFVRRIAIQHNERMFCNHDSSSG